MEIIPSLKSFSLFRTISYYDYLAINECIFKAMKTNLSLNGDLPEEPPSRSILIGRFHHKIMEYIYACQTILELKKQIEIEIQLL